MSAPRRRATCRSTRTCCSCRGEGQTGRVDCGIQGVPDPVSKDRVRGIRIFDISNMSSPKLRRERADVPRLAHAHGRHAAGRQGQRLHLRLGLGRRALGRRAAGLQGRRDRRSEHRAFPSRSDQGSARGTADRRPSSARRASSTVCRRRRGTSSRAVAARAGQLIRLRPARPAVQDLAPAPVPLLARQRRRRWRGRRCRRGAGGRRPRPTPDRISATTSRSIRRSGSPAARAAGYGLLLDIKDVANPKRIDRRPTSNMSFWHSATFSNDGTKMLFSDEWGGGAQPRCRDTDKLEWGADALFTIENGKLDVQELLQDAGGADVARELRRAQRIADPDSRPRGDGAGWYQGGISGLRLDRRRRSRRRSPTSIAVHSTPSGSSPPARGPSTGTTASS